ncbi:adhesion G protein-coupled receptor E5-like [Rhincodon typus]|uniref:adhesion G protein-coupled receptor E5-like n=1 Tax=Rhincodon typus TaxID=259920 RepID=UPI00202F8A1E|nr:adhesion G protein-coupled receptor E5-like [Rhincodon typus]
MADGTKKMKPIINNDANAKETVIYFYTLVMQHAGEAIKCGEGFYFGKNRTCIDDNECGETEADLSARCGVNTECYNTLGSFYCTCKKGYATYSGETNFTAITHCREENECYHIPPVCGPNTICYNTLGSFYCLCKKGFSTSSGLTNFTTGYAGCIDINECETDPCSSNATCTNRFGSFECTCNQGFVSTTGEHTFTDRTVTQCQAIGGFYCTCNGGFVSSTGEHNFTDKTVTQCEEKKRCQDAVRMCGTNADCKMAMGQVTCSCKGGFISTTGEPTFTDKAKAQCKANLCLSHICGANTVCRHKAGRFYCQCLEGFSSSTRGTRVTLRAPCIDKDECQDTVAVCGRNASCNNTVGGFHCTCNEGFASLIKRSNGTIDCQNLKFLRPRSSSLKDINVFVRNYVNSLSKMQNSSSKEFHLLISNFLKMMENYTLTLANTLDHEEMKNFSTDEFDISLQAIRNNTIPKGRRAKLSTAKTSMDIGWNNVAGKEKFDVAAAALISYKKLDSVMEHNLLDSDKKLELISKVVTAAVTNKDKDNRKDSVILTFEIQKSKNGKVKCVYWDSSEAAWSYNGCKLEDSNSTFTVCSCSHLSSFAVLMALHKIGPFDAFILNIITMVGVILSLVCLFISIVTFVLCHSIKSVRTTIHTHLCVSLFLAELLFLVGISRTEHETGCAVIAGLLHYLFLACFSWMLLEGVQLYIMVVKVFNANNIRLKYMCLFGYGLPLLVVAISAIAYSKGYGTDEYCWLSLKAGFLWAFIAPVSVIILVNAGFFILTVWQLVNKFSSLNPNMSELKKVRAFTFTAIAQLCLLGCTWIFGMLHFQDGTIAMAYIFTIINSLQGAFIFILHCLCNKQVRDEYNKAFIGVCHMKKASKYSEFSTFSTQALKSTNETGM